MAISESRKRQKKEPRGRWRKQKEHAKRRGIEWNLTFEEWWSIWEESGKYAQRGRGTGKYCMCRKEDKGPYSADNVYIDTYVNNIQDQHKFNPSLKDNLDPFNKLKKDEK